MGETTTRFSSLMPRRRKGVNIGTGGFAGSMSKPLARTSAAYQRCTSRTKPGSRSSRFSQVICLERSDWSNIQVCESFTPECIREVHFEGQIRIGGNVRINQVHK